MYPISTGPDYSGLIGGIGQLIQGQIANSLQKKALEGDADALARLSSVSPQRYNAIGSILQDRRQEEMMAARQAERDRQRAEEENQRKRDIAARFARGYQTANDKKGYLAAGVEQFRQFGLEDLAGMVEQDLSIYNENPTAVEQEYAGIVSSYGDQSSGLPAEAVAFDYLSQGLSPEERQIAQRVRLGLSPRAASQKVTSIGGVPYMVDPTTGNIVPAQVGGEQVTADTVADNKSKIAAEVEKAKADVEAETRPQIEADTAEAVTKAKIGAEREANRPKAEASLRAALRNIDNSILTAQKAAGQVSPMSAGAGGKILANFGGTSAADLRRTVDTLKASLSFDALAEMRRNSPTGGALGSVTERELELLGSTVASLDTAQSPKQLKENLERVIDHYNTYKTLIEESFKSEYSGEKPQSQGSAQTAPRRLKFNPATGRLE